MNGSKTCCCLKQNRYKSPSFCAELVPLFRRKQNRLLLWHYKPTKYKISIQNPHTHPHTSTKRICTIVQCSQTQQTRSHQLSLGDKLTVIHQHSCYGSRHHNSNNNSFVCMWVCLHVFSPLCNIMIVIIIVISVVVEKHDAFHWLYYIKKKGYTYTTQANFVVQRGNMDFV